VKVRCGGGEEGLRKSEVGGRVQREGVLMPSRHAGHGTSRPYNGLAQDAAPLQERVPNGERNKNGRDACACRPEFVCEVVTPR
jgi:hypothetical protein